MQNDEVTWNVINKNFCSFKVKTLREDMCRNAYNVTGKCNRVSCPLANSNYGTVVEHQGKLYLCLKTVERAHLPSKMWEKIKLPLNVRQAKEVIDREMKNVYKKHQIERCKRRTIKLKQMLDRMRRLELKPKEKLVPVKKKTERREHTREKKAEVAAHLEDVIEAELLKRLQQGVYGELYDFSSEKQTEAAEEAEALEQEAAEKRGAVSFEEAEEEEEAESELEGSDNDSVDFDSDEDEEDIEDLEFSDDAFEPAREASANKPETRRSRLSEASEQPSAASHGLLPVARLKRQLASRSRRPREAIRFEEDDEREAMLQH